MRVLIVEDERSQALFAESILRNAGIPFTVRVADVDETPLEAERPGSYVRRLAEAKARAIDAAPGEIVLGADTTVVAAGEILAKPVDAADARRMLAKPA
jgi:septum formation protein